MGLLLMWIAHLISLSHGVADCNDFPHHLMTANAAEAAGKAYDYIVVGGGTAGCPLAATLSEKYFVLVVERGGFPYGVSSIENADEFMVAIHESNEYTSVAQTFVSEDGVTGARGRILGGTSAINGGFFSRASSDTIRKMGWDAKLVDKSYSWVEQKVAFEPHHLGTWQSAIRDSLLEAGVYPDNGYTLHHLPGTKTSATIFDSKGKRHTAADLLEYANPHNAQVLLNATTKRILFNIPENERPRARGVEIVDNEGICHQIFLKDSNFSEVILSAGALGSPQLLMRSGIGPSNHLESLNIPVILNLPGVGQGAADNPGTRISVTSSKPLDTSRIKVVGIAHDSEIYIEGSSAIHRYTDPKAGIKYNFTASIFQKVAHPFSKGEVRLRSTDPRDNPAVKFNYFSDARDLQRCVQGVRLLSKLYETKALKNFGLQFIGKPVPENKSDDAAMALFCMDTLITIWHYHGGCNVGSVINERQEVLGVYGLRVVDASIFEETAGTNPQATIMMMGRYMGLQILQDRSVAAEHRYRNWIEPRDESMAICLARNRVEAFW